MANLPEKIASREALENSDLTKAAREADLADIRARWAARPRTPTRAHWWRYAAAAIILGFIAWSIVLYQESQRPVQLYAQHFDTRSNLNYLSLRGDEASVELPEMEAALRAGRYHEALALSRRITEADPFAVPALLVQALAAMELQDFPLAARALNQALALEMPTADRIAARWYRALVHLGSGEEDAARQELEWIRANSQGQYGSNARTLLEDLNEGR